MKTYNTKLIFENEEEKQLLLKSLELKKEAFNAISTIRFKMRKCGGLKPLHQWCYKKIKKLLPTIPSQYIIKAEQDVVAKYEAIRRNRHDIEEAPQTNRLNIQLDKRIYKWIDLTSIKLTTFDKRIICKFNLYPKLEEMYAKYKLQDPSLFVNEKQEVMLSIVFNDEVKYEDNKKCLGVDLGINRLASTSDGKIYKGNDFVTYKRKIRWNKRKLQAKQNHSHSARKKLRMMRRTETNFSKNYIHHLVNEILVTPANTIVIEDLSKIKRQNKGRSFNDRQAQIPYYLLKTILTYKAASLGKKVVSVKPYNTSKEDHRGLDNGKRKGCRYYGVDGVVLDADLNASNNITFRHNKKHSVSCSALDGQAIVNRLNVGLKLWQTHLL